MKTQDDIIRSIEEKRQTYIDAALDIWDYAEPIFQERKSSRRLADILKKEGFQVTFGVADMPTAFVAVWGQGEPVVGYMGEYDALPDLSQQADCVERRPLPGNTCGHGCGQQGFPAGQRPARDRQVLRLSRRGGRRREGADEQCGPF